VLVFLNIVTLIVLCGCETWFLKITDGPRLRASWRRWCDVVFCGTGLSTFQGSKLKLEAADSPETSINIFQTTRRHIPDSILHILRVLRLLF
jgi:hypothetical protein